MASGSNSTVLTNENNGKFNLVVSFNENSTSTENNTSNITCTAKLTKNNARFDVNNAGVLKVYWHDNRSNTDTEWASLAVTELGYNTTERVATATKNVTHKDDGTLSGYAKATWTRNSSYGHYAPPSGNVSTSNTTLTTIPRASAPTLASSTFNIGDTITVNTNRASSSFTHTITMTYGSTTTTIGTNVGASLSYNTGNIASGLYAVIPNATSLTGTITCTTYSGSTNVGSKTCSFTAKAVANNAKPTFSNFTFADTNSTTTAITGNNQVMISGKSTLAATITSANKATARYSATMKKYTFAVAGLSAEQTYTTSDITKSMGSPGVAASELPSGTRDFVVTAIDSRGYSTAVTKRVTIVPYSAPAINATATRANGFENTTTVNISGTFSRIEVSGTAKNTVNASSGVQYRYKPQNSTTWTIDWTNKAATIDTATGKVTVAAFTHDLDNQTAYDFQFRITDRLQTTTASIVVAVGQPAFWIGADGRAAVGGMPTQSMISGQSGSLEIKGNSYHTSSTGDVMTWAKRTDVNRSVRFGVGAGGTNAGIYDDNAASWMIYDDKTQTLIPRYKPNKLYINPTGRPTSGNLAGSGDSTIQHFLASGSMTTGKPPADAHVLHFNWDNTGNWEGQIAIDADSNKGRLWGRSKGGSSTWGSWYEYKRIIPSEDWVFLGKAVNTSAVTNGQVLKVDIPSDYRNCSLKVMCKLELSANGWVDLRAYDASGNLIQYTVNLVGSYSGGTGAYGYDGVNYFNTPYQNPGAYRCVTMESTSFKNSASGNYRGWNGQCTNGWSTTCIGALQKNNTAIASIRLYTGGTCQNNAMLKVWGMKD